MAEPEHEIVSDEVICPYCGTHQTDVWELGVYEEQDDCRVDCQECSREFSCATSVSYTFSTSPVDPEADRLREEKRKALVAAQFEAVERARAARRAAIAAFTPGTKVRIQEHPMRKYGGRRAVVANKEMCRHGLTVWLHIEGRDTPLGLQPEILERV